MATSNVNSIIFNSIAFAGTPQITETGLNVQAEKRNDVFKREITRNCDGTRGNVCNGTFTDTITAVPCDDTNFGTGRRCSGPSVASFGGDLVNSIVWNTEQSCQNYDGVTFEYAFGFQSGEHAKTCNDAPQCTSSANGGTLSSSGTQRYVCNATCDGAGGCTKAIECFDCFSQNACVKPDAFTLTSKQYVSVSDYTGCSAGVCQYNGANTPFQKATYDYCLNDVTLMKYGCKPSSEIVSSEDPYTLLSYECNIDNPRGAAHLGAPKCEKKSNNEYAQRFASKCSEGACVPASNSGWNSCNGYTCNSAGTSCLTSCSSDSQCDVITAANKHMKFG